MAVELVEGVRASKSEIAAKGAGIPTVHLLHLKIFVELKSQSLDFARDIHLLC